MAKKFTPALAFHWLTPTYDTVCEFVGYGTQLKRTIVTLINPQPNQKILDVGAGTGTFLVELLTAQPKVKAVGIDPDSAVLATARQKLKSANLTAQLIEGSADTLPFEDQTFDLVTSTLVFHHLSTETKRKALQEIHRVLKDEGRFYLTDIGKPQNVFQTILLWIGSLFDGQENMRANLTGMLPELLAEAGFSSREMSKPFRTLRFILASKFRSGIQPMHEVLTQNS
jgi:ubiquinone/menaquinone biosynthesis C-methylase UbiE